VSRDASSSGDKRTESTLNDGLISLAARKISRHQSFLWSITIRRQHTQETNISTAEIGGLLSQEETHAIVAKK
jgi:hypothetical protein